MPGSTTYRRSRSSTRRSTLPSQHGSSSTCPTSSAGALEQRFELAFGGENGERVLSRHFARVERRDVSGTVTVREAEAIRTYLRSAETLAPFADGVPELEAPLVVRRRSVVFVAGTAT